MCTQVCGPKVELQDAFGHHFHQELPAPKTYGIGLHRRTPGPTNTDWATGPLGQCQTGRDATLRAEMFYTVAGQAPAAARSGASCTLKV